MRQIKRSDFASDREFEMAKRNMRKADQHKRQSTTGRRAFEQGE